jgi:hypothetical protein
VALSEKDQEQLLSLIGIDNNPATDPKRYETDAGAKPKHSVYARVLAKKVKCDVVVRASQTYATNMGDERQEQATMVRV